MTRQTSQRIGFAVTAIVLALGASGCGSSGESAGNNAGSSGGTAAKRADITVKRGPLCPTLKQADLGAAFNTQNAFKVMRNLKPGQKYEVLRGEPKVVSKNWTCSIGTSVQPYVSIYASVSGSPYTAAQYDADVKRNLTGRMSDSKATCDDHDSAMLGTKGTVIICSRKGVHTASQYSPAYASVSYYGLADKAYLSCGTFSSDDKQLTTIKSAGEQLCATFMKSVTQ